MYTVPLPSSHVAEPHFDPLRKLYIGPISHSARALGSLRPREKIPLVPPSHHRVQVARCEMVGDNSSEAETLFPSYAGIGRSAILKNADLGEVELVLPDCHSDAVTKEPHA
jgi:hypothetical protein